MPSPVLAGGSKRRGLSCSLDIISLGGLILALALLGYVALACQESPLNLSSFGIVVPVLQEHCED